LLDSLLQEICLQNASARYQEQGVQQEEEQEEGQEAGECEV